jgi:hypothetical protein
MVAVVCLCAQACAFSVRRDEAVTIVAPADRSSVRLPFTIRWTSRSDAQYAVFFDRPPMAPGRDVHSLGKDDEACRRRPDCPDEAWLRARNIYVTGANELRVTTLPDTRPENRRRGREDHRAVIVLVDGAGRRAGEGSWSLELFVRRTATR